MDSSRKFQDNVLFYVCSQQGYIRLSKQVMAEVYVVVEQCQMQSNKAYNIHLNAETSFKRSCVPPANIVRHCGKNKQKTSKQTNKTDGAKSGHCRQIECLGVKNQLRSYLLVGAWLIEAQRGTFIWF